MQIAAAEKSATNNQFVTEQEAAAAPKDAQGRPSLQALRTQLEGFEREGLGGRNALRWPLHAHSRSWSGLTLGRRSSSWGLGSRLRGSAN